MYKKVSLKIAFTAMMSAILIAVQLALSGVKGVELVSALLAVYAFVFGAVMAVSAALCFSLLRCFVFGFFPNVLILYLIYYTFFALCCAVVGRLFKGKKMPLQVLAITLTVTLCSAFFTLFDDCITPLFYSYTRDAAVAYFWASLPTMAVQCVCAFVSTALLFAPLKRALEPIAEKTKG